MLELFTVPIYSEKLNLDTKKITDYCLLMKDTTKSVNISNKGGWQSPPLSGEHVVLNDMFREILKHVETYRKTIPFKQSLNFINLWININGYKDYNVEHIHCNSVVSGVYYLSPNNTDIVFVHPAAQLMQFDWNSDVIDDYNKNNCQNWAITPSQDQLLLFPSWLGHRVEPNLSGKNRISISFNLR